MNCYSPQAGLVRLMKVVTNCYNGGTEGQVLNLARNLDREKFDLSFSCLRKRGDILNEFEKLNAPISEFRIKSLYKPQTLLQQARFSAHLRARRIDIVHSYNFYANFFAIPAARMAGVPLVLASVRDRGVYLTPIQKIAQKWVCSLADRILVNANSIRDWLLEQGYQQNKIVVIKNGIDLSFYAGSYTGSVKNSALRRELAIPSSAPIVVMLSRLNPQKGVDDFIRAAALISPAHPDVRFLIVGAKRTYVAGVFSEDEQYQQDLQQLVQSLGVADRIIFTGHRSDTLDILAEAAVSVLPSYSEGLSNSLLESMAAGVPTVATDVGGNPELVKNRVNGLLVPVKSPQSLAQAIQTILEDSALAKRFGQQAKTMATENFSLEKMTADTQAFYLNELSHSKRRAVRK